MTLSWSDYFTSRLEGVLARGDRRLGYAIERAYALGCRFDGWTKQLNKEAWTQAFADCDIDPDIYTRERGEDEILPWNFVDMGINKNFFLRERRRAYEATVTGSCKKGCAGCGLQGVCPAAKGDR